MPKLIHFSVEAYHMKQTHLRLKLRADTRTGKKLCWDKSVVAHDILRRYSRLLSSGKPVGIYMWFTGTDAELVMFKLASNIDGVRIVHSCNVDDDEFKALDLQVRYALEQFTEYSRRLKYNRWNYAMYQDNSKLKNEWARKVVSVYQEYLKEYQIHPDFVSEGTVYETDPS